MKFGWMSESLTSNVIAVKFSVAVPRLIIQMNKRYKFTVTVEYIGSNSNTLCGHSTIIDWLNIVSLGGSVN
jgi:hypothetical protein